MNDRLVEIDELRDDTAGYVLHRRPTRGSMMCMIILSLSVSDTNSVN